MNKYFCDYTEDTPQVVLDHSNKVYTIQGRSLPENALEFYQPIVEWVYNSELETSVTEMIFDIKLEYFNTSSAKQITKILLALQKISKTKRVLVNWHYFEEDHDIKLSGERFSRLIDIDIKLLPYSD